MSSFYGGKQGRTYHIVQRYNSIQDMMTQFAKGGAYTKANYGQYVIIDTVLNTGRSNLENGLLYRRGFDYNQTIRNNPIRQSYETDQDFLVAWKNFIQHPGAGAIYVGQIVGPEGRTPQINLEQWSDFQNQITGQTEGDIIYGGKTQIVINQYHSGKNDDEVKVGYINIEDSHGDTYGAYLAFDIPKLVIEAQVESDNPYLDASVRQSESSLIHPFWYKWLFTIPGGKHGKDIKDIKVQVAEQGTDFSHANYNDVIDGESYFTYTICDYTNSSEGQLIPHQGRWPYRVINEIDSIQKIRSSEIKWDTQSWNSSSTYLAKLGDLYRTSNYAPDTYWLCVNPGIISVNYKPVDITTSLLIGNQDSSLTPADLSNYGRSVWRAVEIPQTTPAHSLNIDYKAGPNDTVSGLRNVDYLAVDKNGKMYVFYSDSDEPFYLTTVRELQYIEIDQRKKINNVDNEDYGKIKIKYTDSTSPSILYNPNILQQVKFINQDDITKSQKFFAKYKRYDNPEVNISEPFNRILAIDRYGDNLICLYSDPNVRAASTVGKVENRDYYKLDWTDPITEESYENLVWKNFGPIGAQYHFQGNYTYGELETTYRNGFGIIGEENRSGWIATVITQDEQQNPVIKLYAFDYNDDSENGKYEFPDGTSTRWYEVMSVAESVVADPNYSILVSEIDENQTERIVPKEDYQKLKENGLWFVVTGGHDN